MRAPEPTLRPSPVFLADCARCRAQLRILDDIPAEVDVAKSFHKAVTESFVVVPTSEPDEFVEGKPSQGADDARGQAQPRVAPLEEVSRVEQIMALAAGQSEQDQPVCADCLKHVEAEVERLVAQAEDDNKTYLDAYNRLQEELAAGSAQEAEELEADIAAMEAEERQLLGEIEACKREEAELLADLARQRRQQEQLRREEEEFWRSVAEFQLDTDEDEEERAATAAAIRYATSELQRLRRSNVLNEMFHISHEGPFGTINGFRLGRLPEQPVPWEEVNAAWGQACLLLDALVKKCRLTTQYKLLPRGSYSAIQVGGDVFELYSSDGGLSRFFLDRRFDLGMSSFLGCLRDLSRFLQRDATIRLPFKIEDDKVGGFSVRVQFNQDERWTKALKFMLTNLKWIIAFVESRDFGSKETAAAAAGP
eukprot:TRINITY_DN75044_c0_g1_i1.p1 TRINITY_DN75044_c0_g1~~TRINITY_DN75044_c0_g1_i1.p1  ORF type:complete len:423 (-),score=112.77 TRINITY_DN75044_c0_g1_i1:73-1341(-)